MFMVGAPFSERRRSLNENKRRSVAARLQCLTNVLNPRGNPSDCLHSSVSFALNRASRQLLTTRDAESEPLSLAVRTCFDRDMLLIGLPQRIVGTRFETCCSGWLTQDESGTTSPCSFALRRWGALRFIVQPIRL